MNKLENCLDERFQNLLEITVMSEKTIQLALHIKTSNKSIRNLNVRCQTLKTNINYYYYENCSKGILMQMQHRRHLIIHQLHNWDPERSGHCNQKFKNCKPLALKDFKLFLWPNKCSGIFPKQ